MKVSYWHIIKEKEFNDWLESFDFDTEHKSSKRIQFGDAIEYEIFIHHLDLIIKWVVNYKEYNDDMGGCITKILMYTWEGGFSNRSKSIKIEKWDKSKIKQETTYNDEKWHTDGNNIINELDLFIKNLNPDWAAKYIRDKKINELIDYNH
jgi:hypothetical protein